jgi:HlyD family secretion protein
MSASVDIQTQRKNNVLSVPINAVTKERGDSSKDDAEAVFVLQPNKTVKQVRVTTGVQDNDYIEILSGLKKGDGVVSAPYSAISKDLSNDKKVKVVLKKDLFESTPANQ